jgi:hypothetical protein
MTKGAGFEEFYESGGGMWCSKSPTSPSFLKKPPATETHPLHTAQL